MFFYFYDCSCISSPFSSIVGNYYSSLLSSFSCTYPIYFFNFSMSVLVTGASNSFINRKVLRSHIFRTSQPQPAESCYAHLVDEDQHLQLAACPPFIYSQWWQHNLHRLECTQGSVAGAVLFVNDLQHLIARTPGEKVGHEEVKDVG